jgi:alkanesulfonate monooxygenase SsuD/methylene tetrahydromethanopterin reductase-like flavin-dependent oxidoreductase (luciferase family)
VTFRHPGVLAIQVAQVDQMSGGRIELGLGAGWFEREHRAYGIPFPEKRFGMLEEQLAVITGLWSTPADERFSFDGVHYQLADSPALPKPIQARVPVIVGGGGKSKTPALAARFANEFNSGFVEPAEHKARASRVRAACESIGRDPDTLTLSVAGTTAGGATSADAARRAETINSSVERLQVGGFSGTASEIVDRVGELSELGYSRFYFQIMDLSDLDQIEFLGSEVVSQFP